MITCQLIASFTLEPQQQLRPGWNPTRPWQRKTPFKCEPLWLGRRTSSLKNAWGPLSFPGAQLQSAKLARTVSSSFGYAAMQRSRFKEDSSVWSSPQSLRSAERTVTQRWRGASERRPATGRPIASNASFLPVRF